MEQLDIQTSIYAIVSINAMILETKSSLALVGALIAMLAYIPYFRDIFAGKTKPHAFSWLVWGTMSTVAFFAQYSDGGCAGTWIIAMTAIVDLLIFFVALNRGETNITKLDWLCLAGAFMGLAMFTFYEDPPMSLFLISSVYIIGFVPTMRKSMNKPHQETGITFFFTFMKYAFTIIALENYTLITTLYPAVVGVMNAFFVGVLITRRHQLGYRMHKRTIKHKNKSKPRVNKRKKRR